MVEPRFDVSVTRVTPKQFARQIEAALKQGFTFRTLSQALADPDNRGKTMVLTFDDGYQSVFEYAFPVLKAYGLPATIFVVVGYVGKLDTWDVNFANICFPHLSWLQVETLAAAGWEIGSHTLSHLDLTRLPQGRCWQELYQSKILLEKNLCLTIESISYPFGRVSRPIAEWCGQVGYRWGVVMGRTFNDVPANFCIKRQGVYLFDFPWLFQQKIVAKNSKILNFMQRCMDFCSMGTVIVKQGPGRKR